MSHKPKRLILLAVIALLLSIPALGGTATRSEAADSAWDAKYWNNRELSGDAVLQRSEAELNHDWGDGGPGSGVSTDNFSARWRRVINLPAGTYRFTATMDDGMRVWVDDSLIIDSWWDSQVHSMSKDVFLSAGDHKVTVHYYEAGGKAVAKLSWALVGAPPPPAITNWRGEYFNNRDLNGAPALVRDDAQVNFNWGNGSPAPGVINSDDFSVRWSRNLSLTPGRYRFTVRSDDGARLWVNNQLIIDAWFDREPQSFSGEIDLPGGGVPVRVHYYEHGGGAQIQLSWAPVNGTTPSPSPGDPTPPPAPGAGTGIVQSARLNVRTGPGTQHGVIAQLQQGQQVQLAGFRSAEGTWVMINWQGGTAWVSGLPQYLWISVPYSSLQVWQGGPPGTGGPVSGPTARVVNAYYLNVRSGPGTTFSVIKAIPGGTVVSLLGRNAAATWAQGRLPDGTTGWMSASYLSTSVPLSTLPVTG